jgi:hypothetical protein
MPLLVVSVSNVAMIEGKSFESANNGNFATRFFGQ